MIGNDPNRKECEERCPQCWQYMEEDWATGELRCPDCTQED